MSPTIEIMKRVLIKQRSHLIPTSTFELSLCRAFPKTKVEEGETKREGPFPGLCYAQKLFCSFELKKKNRNGDEISVTRAPFVPWTSSF